MIVVTVALRAMAIVTILARVGEKPPSICSDSEIIEIGYLDPLLVLYSSAYMTWRM